MTHSLQHLISKSQTLSHVVVATLSHLRTLNGIIKKLGKRQSCDSNSSRFGSRYAYLLPLLWIGGCTSLKKAAMIGGGSLGAGAIASIATSGTAPVLLAGAVGASATSVVADVMTPSKKGGVMPTAASCAPDNFWTLLGDLVSMGGWLLILVVMVPMVLGWILPGPLERKKKQ
jgi:hypothetical protein